MKEAAVEPEVSTPATVVPEPIEPVPVPAPVAPAVSKPKEPEKKAAPVAAAPPSGDDPRALNYMKLKKWMVAKGAPKADVDKCPDKDHLVLLLDNLKLS